MTSGFDCLDCGIDTSDGQYYMLHNWLWQKINPDIQGMLCIPCAETRLGRKLVREDFVDCRLNEMFFTHDYSDPFSKKAQAQK
jgi:hypothetical protein